MKTVKVKIYTAKELKRYRPEGFKAAYAEYLRGQDRDGLDFEISDLMGALKGLFRAAGVTMRDWSIGAYARSYIRAEFPSDGAAGLSGPRAMAWLENNLLGDLRVPWTGAKRAEVRKYGAAYYAGQVPPCPFTGMCYDDDLLDALRENVRGGMDLKAAFEDLARVAGSILEKVDAYQRTEEYFLDEAAANGREFRADGQRA